MALIVSTVTTSDGGATTGLFTDDELAAIIQAPVDAAPAAMIRTLVLGLIQDATGISYADRTAPATVTAVALQVAARAYLNPSGLQSETIGSYSYNRGAGAGTGVFLTPEERKTLRRVSGRTGVGSLGVTRGGIDGVFVPCDVNGHTNGDLIGWWDTP